uniref:Uncharacterized protein n=1 Tax=Arundo donax TaxID=35708 RepID=A0A0A8YN60_ARUDO
MFFAGHDCSQLGGSVFHHEDLGTRDAGPESEDCQRLHKMLPLLTEAPHQDVGCKVIVHISDYKNISSQDYSVLVGDVLCY